MLLLKCMDGTQYTAVVAAGAACDSKAWEVLARPVASTPPACNSDPVQNQATTAFADRSSSHEQDLKPLVINIQLQVSFSVKCADTRALTTLTTHRALSACVAPCPGQWQSCGVLLNSHLCRSEQEQATGAHAASVLLPSLCV